MEIGSKVLILEGQLKGMTGTVTQDPQLDSYPHVEFVRLDQPTERNETSVAG